MDNAKKKIGIMVSVPPGSPAFERSLSLAEQSLRSGNQVYFYFIDHAVEGIGDARFGALQKAGAHLYACAHSVQVRGLTSPSLATLAGMTVLSDIMASTDEFQSFN
jgi:sulfur relay (sulfurtransferase) complex TusBCD TusD component (DsrE family)